MKLTCLSHSLLVCVLGYLTLLGAILVPLHGNAQAPGQEAVREAFENSIVGGQSEVDRLLSNPSEQRQRFGIVIGIGDYDAAPDLLNAEADANLVGDFLEARDYRVLKFMNLGRRDFEDTLTRVLLELEPGSEVVFYFAGHGFQIGSRNYLVPADAELKSLYDVPHQTISLDYVLDLLSSRSRVHVVILDSCRENPFVDRSVLIGLAKATATITDGFSFQASPINSLLSFSTSPGAVAYDGVDGNSPFTRALVEIAEEQPGSTVTSILEQVRQRVFAETGGRQIPFESSSLIEPVRFAPAEAAPRMSISEGGRDREFEVVRQYSAAEVQTDLRITVSADNLVTVEGELDREVELGLVIAENSEKFSFPDEIYVSSRPQFGRLSLRSVSGNLSTAPEKLSPGVLQTLVYETGMVGRSSQQLSAESVVDEFELHDKAGNKFTIRVSLKPNPCDLAAGGHLDPQGVAMPRYEYEIQPEVAVIACEEAIVNSPETSRFHYQYARALRAARRPEEAAAAFARAAELGHVRSIMAQGVMIHTAEVGRLGYVEQAAPPAALEFYVRGARLGDPYAFHNLGRNLIRFSEDQEKRELGYDYLLRAAQMGHVAAMDELGNFFIDEDGAYYDPVRALNYFKDGAERGSFFSYFNLGVVYRDGLGGVEQNSQTAAEWFLRASEASHPKAPSELGRLYGTAGQLADVADYERSLEWFLEGLRRGDPWGGVLAARILLAIGSDSFDDIDAGVFAAKAAALADSDASNRAKEILSSLDDVTIDSASQRLLIELGGEVVVDGAFGSGSQRALDGIIDRLGAEQILAGSEERLVEIAHLFWRQNPVREDLF